MDLESALTLIAESDKTPIEGSIAPLTESSDSLLFMQIEKTYKLMDDP